MGEFIKKHIFSDLGNLTSFVSFFSEVCSACGPHRKEVASTTSVCIQKFQNQQKVKFTVFCPLLLPKHSCSRCRQTFSAVDSACSLEQIFAIRLFFLQISCEHKSLTNNIEKQGVSLAVSAPSTAEYLRPCFITLHSPWRHQFSRNWSSF